ncbi:helix-turn-helix domain-containing protein, partial [Escherichia coli]|uniref:helix-turn-helix domain-containing protein n=2 Tax=Gammaproteobacteria TaxID=1236 RepID=UPI00106BBEB6
MSKVKGIAWEHVRKELLSNHEVQAAYEAEERKERLQAMLAEWRNHAGLTRAQVAERMGVTPPT